MTNLSKCTITLAACALLQTAALAQTTRPAPAAPTGAVTLELMDGSMITGTLGLKEIAVDTDFGGLKVPVTRIVSMTPGLDSHGDFQQKIKDLVEKLSAVEAPVRDAAQRELVKLGPSIRGELTRYQGDSDPERKLRIGAIIDEFNEAAGDTDDAPSPGALIRLDSIETADFTIVGRIVPKSFEIASPYGLLTVKRADIRRASKQNAKQEKQELVKTVSVDGTNIVQMKYRETGVRLEKGDKVTIKADGTLTLTPWGSEAMSTPDGAGNYGWYIQNQIPMGALIGKIGKNGSVFKVGSNNSFTADQSGELMLAIAMHQGYANQGFPGKYNAKIRVRPREVK